MRRVEAGGLLVCAAVAFGCSGDDKAGQGAGDASLDTTEASTDAAPAYPAFRPTMPTVVSAGGPVMTKVKVVPVFFQGETLETQLVDRLGKLMTSPDFTTMTSEYGIGAGSVGAAVHIPTPPDANLTDAQIEAWLLSQLDGTHPEWGIVDPAAFPTTIYMVFYPQTTRITLEATLMSCVQFGGYHNETHAPMPTGAGDAGSDGSDGGTSDAAGDAAADADAATADAGDGGAMDAASDGGVTATVIYSVIPRCAATIDQLSAVMSHEIVEAASDPLPTLRPAYQDVDVDHAAWGYAFFGGEIGDMCQTLSGSFYAPSDLGFKIQRSWSNKSALAYHDPCVPIPPGAGPYFNSVPVLNENVDAVLDGRHYMTKGVHIAAGQSKTIAVQLFSEAPTDSWSVVAYDVLAMRGLGNFLSFTFDEKSGQNGDTLHLTITVAAASTLPSAPFVIASVLNGVEQKWVGLVGIR